MWARTPQSLRARTAAGRPAAADPTAALGNQARLRRLSAATGLQPSLEVGAVDDPLEREADAAADRVMRMPDPGPLGLTPAPPRLSRKCAGCEDDEARLMAKAEPGRTLAHDAAPEAVRSVLAGAGRPLDAGDRAFFEPRFGRDLSGVRVHDGADAARSAAAVGAQAYAVRDRIVFAQGRYAPGSDAGRRLLAHELAHTLQQSGAVRRKVVSPTPGEATEAAGHLNTFCPGSVSASGVDITINPGGCATKGAGCDCVCAACLHKTRIFTVAVPSMSVVMANRTLYDGSTASVPESDVWPSTSRDADPTITIPKAGSGVEFGAFRSDGGPFWLPTWRTLAHELCGHGVLAQTYAGDRGDRAGHDATIKTENKIAAERGGPERGLYKSAKQGESFNNTVGDRSKVVFMLKNGLHFEAP